MNFNRIPSGSFEYWKWDDRITLRCNFRKQFVRVERRWDCGSGSGTRETVQLCNWTVRYEWWIRALRWTFTNYTMKSPTWPQCLLTCNYNALIIICTSIIRDNLNHVMGAKREVRRPGTAPEPRGRGKPAAGSCYQATAVKTWLWTLVCVCLYV
jgi:hypothetical protein